MKRALKESWKNFGRLIRFVFWYAIGLAAIFFLLPIAGRVAEAHYDAMSTTAKVVTLVGFVALVVLWHRRSRRGGDE